MSGPSFLTPLPWRSVMPAQGLLNWLSSVTFIVLVLVQILYWPLMFGFLVPSITVALASPLLAFVPSGIIVSALRRREKQRWARAHGFVFHDRPDWPLPQYDVAPFNIGRARRRRIVDVITGRVGQFPVCQLHYRWWNNNKVQFSSHFRNVFTLTLPQALPPLSIGPTISPDAGKTVRFESIAFNEVWSVVCPDARFAKAVITPRTMDRLLGLDLPVTANTRIVIAGHDLVAISVGGNRGSDITRVFSALQIIAEGIPDYVWDEFGVDRQELRG